MYRQPQGPAATCLPPPSCQVTDSPPLRIRLRLPSGPGVGMLVGFTTGVGLSEADKEMQKLMDEMGCHAVVKTYNGGIACEWPCRTAAACTCCACHIRAGAAGVATTQLGLHVCVLLDMKCSAAGLALRQVQPKPAVLSARGGWGGG